MDNRKNRRFSPPAAGGASLLVVFAVLCLTIFALLSLTTVQADARLADASVQAVADYYAADLEAQTILARLRAGERPEGVTFSGSGLLRAEYTCRISDTQELQVSVILEGIADRDYVIERWQAAPSVEWESDESLELWDGMPF